MSATNLDIELADSTVDSPTPSIRDRSSMTVPSNTSERSEAGIGLAPLPPTDQGKDAWLVLAGCSVIQAPVWGLSLSFGIFQDYYSTLDTVGGNKSSLANVGTSNSGILYLSAPITFTLLTRYPRLRRYCGPVRLVLAITGLLLSSFATEVWQIIATQGVVCAIGCGLLYSPTTLYLDEWFIKRKGLAYGVMLASKALVGATLPFITSGMLHRYGVRTTMQAWAVATLVITAPLLFWLKPRIPVTPSTSPQKLSLSFLRLSAFWMLQLGNVLQSLGYFLPSTYLVSYARSIGLNGQTGTLMIALFNATSIPGSLIIGMLNDHFHVTNVVFISSVGSTITVLVFWGLANQVALLAIFVILYGFFAGGFSATWSGVLIHMKKEMPVLDTGLVFGLLAGGRGLGNIISGPLSTVLIGSDPLASSARGHLGYDTQYGWLIAFTGVTALLGGWGWIWRVCLKLN